MLTRSGPAPATLAKSARVSAHISLEMALDRYQWLSPVAGETPDRGRGQAGGDMEPFVAAMSDPDGARCLRGPYPPQDGLQPDPMFVGGEGFDHRAGIARPLFCDDLVGSYGMARPSTPARIQRCIRLSRREKVP